MAGVRVLLTEGSSLTSREVVTCLGPRGHHLEVLDPDRLCLSGFSRWVRKVHRCPHAGADPIAYIGALVEIVRERGIEVVLPTHEQAWLLANAGPLLEPEVRVAVSTPAAFERVQSKLECARLLDGLGLPQPAWRVVESASDVADLAFPYWLKAAFSTAGQGVREVLDARSRDAALETLSGEHPMMAQQPAAGQYGQVQGLFAQGRMVAAHTSVQRGVGVGGSAAARLSVDHGAAREHIATLGRALRWHGGLTLDYLHEDSSPCYIECNPRTVEPGNATASGVNIPELQLRLTLGEELPSTPPSGLAGVRTHGTIALLMGDTSRGGSRRSLLSSMREAITHSGPYAGSAEQLTPLLRDPPSLAPAMFVATRLLLSGGGAAAIAAQAVTSYSIGPDAVGALASAAASRTTAGTADAG